MKLHQIRDLLAVAEKGSLRAAARQLGLAQPSISRSIGQLERELGVALLERQARGTVLTPAGKLFARRASAAASELRRGREEIEQLNEGAEGSITVGFSSVPLLTLLPAAVAPFKKRFARLELRIVDGAFPAIESRLKDGTVDFYAGVAPGKQPHAELLLEKLFDNTRVVVARPGHPLAQAKSLAQLRDAQWVTTSITDDAAAEIADLFELHRLPAPQLGARITGGVLSLMAILGHSDLLAIVPRQWIESPLTRGVLRKLELKEEIAAPPICLIRRAALPLTPAAEFLCDLLRRAGVQYARKSSGPSGRR
ncbi:MAG TPA: LysR substrate-binding domain-containing protein [Burkholderiales bacterium]